MKLLKTKYGEISGYQDLEQYASGNPASLIFTEPIEIKTAVGVIVPQYSVDDHERGVLKPVHFYDNGNIKKAPLQETVEIRTPLGIMPIRVGISFYEDGSVKSVEPAEPYTVETKIGPISAYDTDPKGMGDINSLQFNNQGEVTALSTTENAIILRNQAGGEVRYTPSKKESLCSANAAVTIPLQIEFTGETIRFNHNAFEEYNLSECSFTIIEYGKKAANPFFICGNCN